MVLAKDNILKQKAYLISDLLDSYQKSGGGEWHKSEKVLLAWANLLSALEELCFKIVFLRQQPNDASKSINQLIYENWRSENGVISQWNSFCLVFTQQSDNYLIPKGLNNWQAFLLYRMSDKFWHPSLTADSLIKKTILGPRLNFFKHLWQNNPQDIWQDLWLGMGNIKLIEKGESISGDFSSIGKVNPKNSLSKWASNKIKLSSLFTTSPWVKFWQTSSGGLLAQYNAFELSNFEPLRLIKMSVGSLKSFDYLIDNQLNQDRLIENIENLFTQKEAFHVFLWGEPGMGKSSSIFALLNHFKDRNLKLINLLPSQLQFLPSLFAFLKLRPEKFIIFCDDLSLSKEESNIKLLKSTLDGGIITTNNALLHVTSNRKGLIRDGGIIDEYDSEKNQIIDEFCSLDDRFGLKLYFEAPRFKKLDAFLLKYAKKHHIKLANADKTINSFKRFCLQNQHNQPSGRTVKQFFDQY
ncbi:MAG: DUF815 domain-containing protein [SAR324 cluster bacterium]|nr:DUF815 domain-containing protein [SAR324 cluster bacterium]